MNSRHQLGPSSPSSGCARRCTPLWGRPARRAAGELVRVLRTGLRPPRRTSVTEPSEKRARRWPMTWPAALVLGVVQGLTEFLPVSSSAHLRAVAALAGWPDPAGCHFDHPARRRVTGVLTSVAILPALSHLDAVAVDPRAAGDPRPRSGWYVIVGTVPIAVLGFIFQDHIETCAAGPAPGRGHPHRVRCRARCRGPDGSKPRPLETLTPGHAVASGFAQAMASVPGVSRSGGTISVGLTRDYTRQAAARYRPSARHSAVSGLGWARAARRSAMGPLLRGGGRPCWPPCRVRCWVRGHCLVPALHRHPPVHPVRGVPHRRRVGSTRAHRRRCPHARQLTLLMLIPPPPPPRPAPPRRAAQPRRPPRPGATARGRPARGLRELLWLTAALLLLTGAVTTRATLRADATVLSWFASLDGGLWHVVARILVMGG